MKRTTSLTAVGFFVLVILSASALAGGSSIDLTIVYSNNINGQVRPCPS